MAIFDLLPARLAVPASPRVRGLLSARVRVLAGVLLVCAAALPACANLEPSSDLLYLEHVKTLAAPGMEGRGAGTKGLQKASEYIESRFKEFGLKPAGTSSYLQPFTVTTGARLKGENHLTVQGTSSKLALGKDYTPLSFSSTGSVTAPLVFAGYGATAEEFQYDDYANLDVSGKVVIVLRYEPEAFVARNRNQRTPHAAIITKAINARNHGAKALILVNGKVAPGEEDELLRFGRSSGPENAGIPIVQVRNAIVHEWLQNAGKSLSQLQEEINKQNKPLSFALPDSFRVSLAVSIEKVQAKVANVLGYLPGKTQEYIIIGAHYDHLGHGEVSSLAPTQIGQIHHGADDNASGTAGMLELARVFSRQGGQLDRGILFMAFAGEELGLLGSAHWGNAPTLPIEKAVAMINMDMIGRVRDSKLYVGGIGTGSTFKGLFDEFSHKYKFDISYSVGGYASSDHTSFVAKKIPVLFFFSGLHPDYHKPSDTWEKINADSAAQVVNLVGDIANSLASAGAPPKFVTVETGTSHSGAPTSGGGGGYGPYFGSIPDFAENDDGVKFSDVRPGSPAAKAGLKAGDVLVQFGDKSIKNLYDFTDALRRGKVGDVVEVKVMRDGKPVAASVTLESR